MNILETIAEKTKERIAQEKTHVSLKAIQEQAEAYAKNDKFTAASHAEPAALLPFEAALRAPGLSFICECKKASPSKGIIAEEFPYVKIAQDYELGGASAISCLTEPFWFKGHDNYLKEIASAVSIPVLRKDFVIDEYMIYQAKTLGASAVLLICSLLSDSQLSEYHKLATQLNLSVLVEAHDEKEVERAAQANARIIGVNNRDLKTFKVDLNTSLRLRNYAPEGTLFVSESGINEPRDIEQLSKNKTDAVLIGELLMRSPHKQETLRKLRHAAQIVSSKE